MPRGVFNWNAEDIIRFLKERGFVWTHGEGSHQYYQGTYGGQLRQVHVPFHGARAIKPRTLRDIIEASGIPKEEWLRR